MINLSTMPHFIRDKTLICLCC